MLSRPPRGAWVEISALRIGMAATKSRPPRGAWVEIKYEAAGGVKPGGRAPHGARGLKSAPHVWRWGTDQSRPPRGAWVEISARIEPVVSASVAPPTGRVG